MRRNNVNKTVHENSDCILCHWPHGETSKKTTNETDILTDRLI